MKNIKRLLFRLGLFLAITFEDKDSPAFNKWKDWAGTQEVPDIKNL
jgi:hypothetical protein